MSLAKRDPKHLVRVREALDRWMARDRAYRMLTRAIHEAQKKMRSAVGDDGWAAYLELEEHVNARHATIVAAACELATRRRGKVKAKRAAITSSRRG